MAKRNPAAAAPAEDLPEDFVPDHTTLGGEAVNEDSPDEAPQQPPFKPNPDILRRDPMAEMFGPGSTIKMVGDYENDEMPDEIRGVIEENGLSKRDFSCTLKEVPDGSLNEGTDNSSASVYVKNWKRAIPSMEYIAREHGPGNYLLVLTWRKADREEGRVVPMREVVPISISTKCAGEYKKHQLDKKINEASATGSKVRDAIVEKTIEGQLIHAITGKREGEEKPPQSPKEYLEEIMTTVKMLGLPVGGFGTPAPKIEWDKVIAVAAPIVTGIFGVLQQNAQRRSEESNKMLMLLLSQSQSASSQVVDLYKTMAMKPAADNPLKELQNMVMSAMDIKEMMNPPKETLSDKIFRVVEMVAPQILNIAAAAAQSHQPPQGPAVEIAKMYAKSDPNIKKLKEDPAEMVKFVNRLDERIGWENADVVLGVVEFERPAACPHDPAKQYPPQQQAEDGVIEEHPE